MRHVFAFLLLVCSTVGFSQNPLDPVTWTVSYSDISKDEVEVTYTAKIMDKWHTYSQRATDDGPVPTSFTITPGSDFTLIGKVEEDGAHEEYVKAFEAKVYVFEGTANFKQKIKRTNNKGFTLATYIEFMSCNDVMCNPPKTISIPLDILPVKK